MKNLSSGRVILITVIILAALTALYLFLGRNGGDTPDNPIATAKTPLTEFSIVKTYPHDKGSYTQGLTVYKGELYEGTGQWNESRLLKTDVTTGNILQSVKLDSAFFGEGIAILRDTIYQLTWENKVVFVYTLKDFKKIKEYKIDGQGWGLTTDGTQLILSDGTSNLYYYNPSDFTLLKQQTITELGSLTNNLNELEYIDGYIYANQYQTPYILKINPADGKVVAKTDLTDLWKRAKQLNPAADVPNGIAYDESNGKIYITGKYWPELYEIQLAK